MGVSHDTYAWLVRNRIVTLEMMKDDLVDYFANTDEVLSDVLWPEGGFFDGVTLAADGNDKFKIGGLSGIDGTVGGDLLNLTDRQADVEGIKFSNAPGVDYHVGLRDARIPDTSTPNITINPKDGLPNWTFFRHIVGISGTPDAVVDNGNGTITLTVDSVTEAAVNNTGRVVKVFQLLPAKGAITDAIALETLTVAWDVTANKITTVGSLGQTTISTTPGDYVIVLVGPRVLRYTDLSTDTTYAYVGTVQGVGAGAPPTVFDVSAQRILFQPTANLWQVLRTENVPPNRLKIDVKAIAGESGVNQIQVQSSAPAVVFSVDEAGNVSVEGDLEVKGTTTTRDVDQVNAYNAYFDNLEAGNADTDVHAIQGEWTHTSVGGGITAFAIDGDTGRVGIGGTYDAAAALKVTGDSLFAGDLHPNDGTRSLGGPSNKWKWFFISDAADEGVGSHLVPNVVSGRNLGNATYSWKTLFLSTAPNEGVGSHLVPATAVLDLGNVSYKWQRLYLSDSAGKGVAGNLVPAGASAYDLGAASYKWKKLFLSGGAGEGVATDLVSAAGTEKLGTSTRKWAESHFAKLFLSVAPGEGIATSLVPITASFDLGSASYPWQKLFLGVSAGLGVATSLVPVTTSLDLGNSSYPWKKLYLGNGTGEGVVKSLVPQNPSVDLGNASYPWRNLFLATASGAGVSTDLVPATTSLDLGNSSYPWKKLYLGNGTGEGVGTNLVPLTTALDLGNASYPWRKLFLSTAAGLGVATSLIPATTLLELGNASYPWKEFFLSNTAGDGVGTDLNPTDDLLFDFGTSAYQWKNGYFGGTVRGGQLRATNDIGGEVLSTTFTNGTATGVGVNGSIGAAGGNSNVGFLVIYVGADTMYVPYWDNITT